MAENMIRAKVLGGNSARWVGDKATGRRIMMERNGEVDLTAAELKALGPTVVRRIQATEPAAGAEPSADSGEPAGGDDDTAELLTGSAANVVTLVGGESDEDLLTRALDAEKAKKAPRKTVVEALEARLAELAK